MNYPNDKKQFHQNDANCKKAEQVSQEEKEKMYEKIPDCIEKGMTKEYCDIIEKKVKDNYSQISVSQLRKFFSAVKLLEKKGIADNLSDLIMLKPKLAYAVGRAKTKWEKDALKDFYETVSEVIDRTYEQIVSMKKVADSTEKEKRIKRTTKNFVDFFEAIIAYHKLYGKQQ